MEAKEGGNMMQRMMDGEKEEIGLSNEGKLKLMEERSRDMRLD